MKDISFELLHKYNVQGPRYTSYPPAPSWKTDIGTSDYETTIAASNKTDQPAPLSLYFHLPFCQRLCFFCGCHTFITGRNRSFEPPYIKALHKEIEWLGSRVDRSRKIIQLHLGGGTPTYSSPSELAHLMETVRKFFTFDDHAEVGIEVDPRTTSEEHLKVLSQFGFNRLSMGVQDFNPAVQKAVNRIQSYDQTKAIVESGRKFGYTSINMDLIYGLPFQTPDSFRQTIEQILSLSPDRLAVYSYAHVPWLKEHQEHFEKDLPTERQKYEIFVTALRQFTDAGFEYIGMDHFAKPNDELSTARRDRTLWRNFMGYTTKAGTDLFGLGVSAIGSVNGGFFQNIKETAPYQDVIGQNKPATFRGFILSKDDKIRSRVIQSLLCHAVVKKKEIEAQFGITFDDYFRDSLSKLSECVSDGLVELTHDEIRPTELGRVFLRNLAMPFDAYLPKPGEKKVFSRTL